MLDYVRVINFRIIIRRFMYMIIYFNLIDLIGSYRTTRIFCQNMTLLQLALALTSSVALASITIHET